MKINIETITLYNSYHIIIIIMRIWSFHPKYLDKQGLSRAINEGIAGNKALRKTGEGYPPSWEKHSQLERFKTTAIPGIYSQLYLDRLFMIKYNSWMLETNQEPFFDDIENPYPKLKVTIGQLKYEWQRYLKKISKRSPKLYEELKSIELPEPHPLFNIIDGDVESWEKVKQ